MKDPFKSACTGEGSDYTSPRYSLRHFLPPLSMLELLLATRLGDDDDDDETDDEEGFNDFEEEDDFGEEPGDNDLSMVDEDDSSY